MKITRPDRPFELLHELELRARRATVAELIRLLGSPHFDALTPQHIRRVGEYGAIEIEGERYFERAFSPGKEAASSLALAQIVGAEPALEDLQCLDSSLSGAEVQYTSRR